MPTDWLTPDRRSIKRGSGHVRDDRGQPNGEVSPIADQCVADDRSDAPHECEDRKEETNVDGKNRRRREEEEEGEETDESEEIEEEKDKKELIDLLSYILRRTFKYRTKYIPLNSTVDRFEREELDQCCAFLSFSESHVWAYRRVGNTW